MCVYGRERQTETDRQRETETGRLTLTATDIQTERGRRAGKYVVDRQRQAYTEILIGTERQHSRHAGKGKSVFKTTLMQ